MPPRCSPTQRFCRRTLDPLVSEGRFDFIADLQAVRLAGHREFAQRASSRRYERLEVRDPRIRGGAFDEVRMARLEEVRHAGVAAGS